MVLQKKAFRTSGMQGNLVHTLTELRVLVGQEYGTNAAVAGCPGSAAIITAVDTPRGDRDVHPLRRSRVEHNRVQRETAVAGHPARTMRMIEQSPHQGPGIAAIARLEESGR